MKENKKMGWFGLALMAFTTVWGFGNVVNGFGSFNGVHAVIPWVGVMLLYFVPYALMVGELGSTFSANSGGVSSWIKETIGGRAAFFAGWMYWIVHMPYISQKPSTILISFSWMVTGKNLTSEYPIVVVQLVGLGIFLLALFLATRGLSLVRIVSSIAGTAAFVLSILFIILIWSSNAITGNFHSLSLSWSSIKPVFSSGFIFNLSILIFAVGGCEKISPYVNQMKKPRKDFPGGMIALAIMVSICAVLGTLAMGMIFDSDHIPEDLLMNGAYYAFQRLGDFLGMGNFFLILFSAATMLGNIAALIISIDAPLKMLLGNADEKYIPKSLLKKNKHGSYINGIILVGIIVSILIILPAFGIGNMNALVKWLIKVNSVCMPLRYLWVFVAYIALKKKSDSIPSGGYVFIKNKTLGTIVGGWCFLVTAFACVMGIYSEDTFELIMNIATPIILVAIGFLLPAIAKRKKKV